MLLKYSYIKDEMAYNKKYADWSKKIWIDILAPQQIFNEMKLGETPVNKDNIENVLGRTVELNAAFILNNFKYQNYKIKFKVTKVSGLRAYSEIVELSLYPAYVRRITRVGTSKIDDSIVFSTQEGFKVRVKPLVITHGKAHRSQKHEIRMLYRKYLQEKITSLKYYELIEKVLNYDLQNEVKPILNKIFPIERVEVRRIILLTPILQKEKIENK